jgi:hypothetical protein
MARFNADWKPRQSGRQPKFGIPIETIARHANVKAATVRRVLNETGPSKPETESSVRAALAELLEERKAA